MRVEPTERTAPGPVGAAPWSVKAYAAVQVLGVLVWMVLDGNPWRGVGGLVIGGAIALGILFGHRAAWVLAVIFTVLGAIGVVGFVMVLLAGDALSPEQWSSLGFYLASTAMLLHPLTRVWVDPRDNADDRRAA